jgi:hypothetical protein
MPTRFFATLFALTLLAACNRQETASSSSSTSTAAPDALPTPPPPKPAAPLGPAPKIGGLYASKYADGTWHVIKVLALDDPTVHVRVFANTYSAKPAADLDSAKLEVLVGHAPIPRETFDEDQAILLRTEEIAEAELEGYRAYLESNQPK